MRSIRFLAVATGALVLGSACGGGGDVGPNVPPVASFTAPTCAVSAPCAFTSTSTDADGTISTTVWDFGNTQTATGVTASTTFATAATFQVKLTVTDNAGATGTVTVPVTVGAGNLPPVASFDLPPTCVAGTPCGFHSTSTDPDGDVTITGAAWNFGDPTSPNNTADTPDATHTFAAAGPYTVTLTVTDDQGAISAPVTQQLTVSPAASQSCTTTLGTTVNCLLNITQNGQVKITLVSSECELGDNKLTITAPVAQEAINNVCFQPDNTVYIVKDAAGQPRMFTAGEQLGIRFRRGQPGPTNPPAGDPGVRVVGSFPNLTLNVDDGGNAAAQGEPDFNDAVLLIQPAP